VDVELGVGVQLALVRQRLVADLVQGIAGVGDELAQKDLLVGVEGVDDQRQQLVDVALEAAAVKGWKWNGVIREEGGAAWMAAGQFNSRPAGRLRQGLGAVDAPRAVKYARRTGRQTALPATLTRRSPPRQT
jgi:hypothetical protein